METNFEQTDAQLISAFKAGDETAFDQLIQRHSGRAYQLAYGVLGNREDAQEVAQDVFIRIHRALYGFRGDSKFTTWLYRITLNLAKNKYRWNKRRGEGVKVSIDASANDGIDNTLDCPDDRESPQTVLQANELQQQLQAELDKMPQIYRMPLVMRIMDDLSYEQIADALHCVGRQIKVPQNAPTEFPEV